MMSRQFGNVAYFPSFEIATGQFNRGAYFARDLRSVTEEGVRHVMSMFFRHACVGVSIHDTAASDSILVDPTLREAEKMVKVLCDEELLDASEVDGSAG